MGIISQEIADQFAIYNGDNMEVLPEMKTTSVDCSIYSPPFPELYQYSNDPRDMSNCATYQEGMDHFGFVINEIFRLTKPGRLSCVHCMDLKNGTHFQRDFPGDIIKLHEKAGFHFYARITIWKDPWLIARRTRMRSLMHKMVIQDSSMCKTAGPDYVLVFKKGGENKDPVTHKDGLKANLYAGFEEVPPTLVKKFANFKGDQKLNRLSQWIWRRYASPVWTDIRTGSLLEYKEAREKDDEKHVCPLQLDVIERLLCLYSNPGDTLLTPFMGVGSEAYGALINKRKAIGIELKTTYYNQAKKHIIRAIEKGRQGDQIEINMDKVRADDFGVME